MGSRKTDNGASVGRNENGGSDLSRVPERFKAPIGSVRVLPIFEYNLPIRIAVALLALLDPEGWQSDLMHRS